MNRINMNCVSSTGQVGRARLSPYNILLKARDSLHNFVKSQGSFINFCLKPGIIKGIYSLKILGGCGYFIETLYISHCVECHNSDLPEKTVLTHPAGGHEGRADVEPVEPGLHHQVGAAGAAQAHAPQGQHEAESAPGGLHLLVRPGLSAPLLWTAQPLSGHVRRHVRTCPQ